MSSFLLPILVLAAAAPSSTPAPVPAPAARIAVLVEDPAESGPCTAALERALQKMGYEVVAAETAAQMREALAPKSLLGNRLPEGLSVFEADAILAGAVDYGEPSPFEGIESLSVSLTARLIDLATARASVTFQKTGVGIGAGGPALKVRGAEQAVDVLFAEAELKAALENLGQASGSVTLVLQAVPNREVLQELRQKIERVFAGAPVRELYFAKGMGKLVIGGGTSKSMVGADVADILSENKGLALVVEEVANTRIVARFDRARSVRVFALVLEPRLPRKHRSQAEHLGKYLAAELATLEFARASYQAGKLSRPRALARARSVGAQIIVESELLVLQKSTSLLIRVIDVETGKPIFRQQRVVPAPDASLGTAEAMIAELGAQLPERLSGQHDPTTRNKVLQQTAERQEKAP